MCLFVAVFFLLGNNMSVRAAEEGILDNEIEEATLTNINVSDTYDVTEEENGAEDDQESYIDKVESTEDLSTIIERAPSSEVFSEVDANGLKWDVANGVLKISGNGMIERNASFTNNDNLREGITSIVIEEDITGIGKEAFWAYRHLEEVSIPSSVTIIDEDAFGECGNLSSVVIPDSVREIGEGAFYKCGLTSVALPSGLTEIKDGTFAYCRELSEIVIPDGVIRIGHSAFYNCGITSISMPESVIEIGMTAFMDCDNLTEVVIPDKVTEISISTFESCNKLTEVIIPNSVTKISSRAFGFCGGLTRVTIPDSVRSIGEEAFGYCMELQTVVFQGNAPEIISEGTGEEPFSYVTATAYYPLENQTYTEEVKAAYGAGLTWEAKAALKIILETTRNTHVLGTSDTATITCNGELKDFVNVFVDGREVDKKNYILEEGSTILTFTAQYLNTLSVGKHAVTLNYTYGSVDTELIILSSESAADTMNSADGSEGGDISVNPATARTGDNTPALTWLLIALTALAVGIGTVFVRRKRSI